LGRIKLYAPVVQGLTGTVRSEVIVDRPSTTANLGDRDQIPYAIADPGSAILTVRDRATSPSTTIPRPQWRFSSDGKQVEYSAGFQPNHIYEVIYTGKDPAVVGLGPAAVRDYVSYLKQNGEARHAIGYGTSQSGRFLRTFVYYGFNADEQGRKVFDGVWAHVAAAARGSFNHRFAQPSRDGHQFSNLFYPTDLFPFTDDPETDRGITDSVLAQATKANVVPKIFYTNGSYEYFGRSAALIHMSLDGKKDVAPAPNTRMYFLAGTQHQAGTPSVRNVTQNFTNPADYRFPMRALLVAMNAWITDDTPPPDSQIPRIGKDDLVQPGAYAFPKIPGVAKPTPYAIPRLDFGPDFRTKGIVAFEPPKIDMSFPTRLPQVDSDGNETSGIRMPELAAPLATYTGWNLRDPKVGAPDMPYSMIGSMIPFHRTRADRMKAGDPRPSIEERYRSREEYLHKVEQAAQPLVRNRFLLDRDVARVVAKAGAQWDMLMKR
jgi:alpha/beta hydrolase family protein